MSEGNEEEGEETPAPRDGVSYTQFPTVFTSWSSHSHFPCLHTHSLLHTYMQLTGGAPRHEESNSQGRQRQNNQLVRMFGTQLGKTLLAIQVFREFMKPKLSVDM